MHMVKSHIVSNHGLGKGIDIANTDVVSTKNTNSVIVRTWNKSTYIVISENVSTNVVNANRVTDIAII